MNDLEAMGCPDAEMLAAWSDGGLRADERLRVEEHAAACGRCQAHLAAIARTAAVEQEAAPSTRRHRFWPWLVPAAGAAAAVTVWVIVQPVHLPEPPQPTSPQLRSLDAEKADAVRDRAEPMQSPAETPPVASQRAEPKLEALARERRDRANAAPAAAPPAAPAPADQTISGIRQSEWIEFVGLRLERSPDGGLRWDASSGAAAARLTAGVSPSPSIFWLVGREGLVLRSADGVRWREVPFPEDVDLTAVQASSDTTATVTTADARVFTTSDGGLTWQRR